MKRFKHGLSHYKLLTMDMGKLVPVACYEVLPGDSIQQRTSALIRFTPLVAPLMHSVQVRIHHWFVPNRLLFTTYGAWEKFITGGSDGLGEGVVSPTTAITPAPKGLLDYLGLPVGASLPTVSVLPPRAYLRIYNQFYRDEDLVPEVADTNANYDIVQPIAWEKDYFTASRPWAQKGPDVVLPLGTSAPVVLSGPHSTGLDVKVKDSTGADSALAASAATVQTTNTAPGGTALSLLADLANATASTVNSLRRNMALQRFQEARAAYGHRYSEYLASLGVKAQDSRLDRPEYLGGGKANVAFSEVLQTGPNVSAGESTDGVGDLFGHGITALRTRGFRRFIPEHGFIMSLMSIRPRTVYLSGRHRMWQRPSRYDYWQKELQLIGQQEVYSKEIFADGTAGDDNVFGYNDRYSEYRHQESSIAGEFRNTLNYWHLARIFASRPTLNASFVNCDPSKRIFQEQTQHSCWVMVNHSIQARRFVAKNTTGRII